MKIEEFRQGSRREKPIKREPVQALKVGFILLPRFTLAPFASILDVLRLAADEGDHSRPITCSWNVMSPSSAPITSSSGVQIIPTSGLLPPQSLHYIVVVGGLLHGDTDLPKPTLKYLKEADRCGIPLIGVCTGSFALMRAGLMQNKKICVSWFHYNDLINEFPDVTPIADQLFVIDGNRITCAGGAGAIDLGAWLIERHLGPSIAQKSLHIMLVDHARSPDTPQPQPLTTGVAKDMRVRRAVLLIEQNIATPLSATELSEKLGISTRQLDRLFMREYKMPVAEFYRRFRVKYGRWLLQNSELSNAQIAIDCGFSDYSHFYRVYRNIYGEQPARH